jgi:hypothetical protein
MGKRAPADRDPVPLPRSGHAEHTNGKVEDASKCEKLVKIGARIVRHGRYVVFQLAEVAVPRALFAEILRRIGRLRGSPLPAT